MTQEREWPDYTPLKQIAEDSEGLLALDFSARVGARPYITYEDGDWSGVSVGPFGQTDDGKTVITTKDLDVDESQVVDMLDGARLVQLRLTRNTPIEEYDDVVYGGDGPVDDEPAFDKSSNRM